MESVGFLSALLAKGAASVMNRFLQSHAWHHWLSTLVFGLSPILVAPTSWMISPPDRKSTRLNSSHANISYAVFCLKQNSSLISQTSYAACVRELQLIRNDPNLA